MRQASVTDHALRVQFFQGAQVTGLNPYRIKPRVYFWAKGYVAGRMGDPKKYPYVNYSSHGGTIANRIWGEGWDVGEMHRRLNIIMHQDGSWTP